MIGADLDSSSSEVESECNDTGDRPASPDRVAPQPQGRPLPTLNERDPPPAPDEQVIESEEEAVSEDTSIINDQSAAVSNKSPYFLRSRK